MNKPLDNNIMKELTALILRCIRTNHYTDADMNFINRAISRANIHDQKEMFFRLTEGKKAMEQRPWTDAHRAIFKLLLEEEHEKKP
jgi:hypothetical protein